MTTDENPIYSSVVTWPLADWLNKEFNEVKEFREFSDYFANLTNFLNLLTQPSVECTNFLKYFDFLKKVANFTRFYKRIKFFTLNYKQNS